MSTQKLLRLCKNMELAAWAACLLTPNLLAKALLHMDLMLTLFSQKSKKHPLQPTKNKLTEEDLLKQINHLGRELRFKKDQHLFFAQDTANGFYYIKEGLIRLYKADEMGNEIEVNRLGKANFIGEVILFSSDFFPVNALAVEPTTTCFFDKTLVLRELSTNSAVCQLFLKLLARKCMALNQNLELLTLKTVKERLMLYLTQLRKDKQQLVVELPMSKVELAKSLGTISETLSRNLKQLETEGILRVEGRIITFLASKKA